MRTNTANQQMKSIFSKILPSIAGAALLTLIWAGSSMGALAQPIPPDQLLRQAYFTLSVANQNYNGHRYEAMREIETAANYLKFDLRGDGRGLEHQRVSDEQLRSARSLLEQARVELDKKPRKHIEKAIKEIDLALKVH
jgi:hypothetical protein